MRGEKMMQFIFLKFMIIYKIIVFASSYSNKICVKLNVAHWQDSKK